MCRSKLVSYYLSKGFEIIDQDYQAPKDMYLRVKQRIHAINMFDNDYLTTCSTTITSVKNNLKKTHLSENIFNSFISTYYDDQTYPSEILFQQYTYIALNNIYHPPLIE